MAILGIGLAASQLAHAGVPDDYRGLPFSDPFHGAGPARIPGIVQCANYDQGGEGVAYHDATGENEGSGVLNRQEQPYNHMRAHASAYIWHFRESEGVDLSYVKDWADLNHANVVTPPINQHYIGWASDGEWTNYTVDVTKAGDYRVNALYSHVEKEVTKGTAGQPSAELAFLINGNPASVCTVPRPTEGWHHWDYGPIATLTFPEAGRYVLTFRYRRGNNWAFWVFEKEAPQQPVGK
ncbi:MAG: hypothetical protein SFV32_03525 [Opitutaceae bacterium]|nr:hypothetical protein [Opitutaceae bacterium]